MNNTSRGVELEREVSLLELAPDFCCRLDSLSGVKVKHFASNLQGFVEVKQRHAASVFASKRGKSLFPQPFVRKM